MGNSDLRSLSQIEEVDIEEIDDSVVAVDAYNWLYKYVTTTVRFTNDDEYTREDGVEVPNLHGGITGMKRFFNNDITPIFVFDGDYHEKKQVELTERRQARQSAKEDAEQARAEGNEIEAAKLESRSKSLSDEMIESTMDMLDALDLPYVVAPQSGESQAAYMVQESDTYDYVVSDDYDSLLFGSPVTVRNFTSSSRPFERLRLDSTLDELELTLEQLIDVGLLCGTDYNEGVSGYGPKSSVSAIREQGSLKSMIESGEIDMEKEMYESIHEIFTSPEVTDDFPQDVESPLPDFDEARKVLIEKWELPESHVESTLDDIEAHVTQPGLDKWS